MLVSGLASGIKCGEADGWQCCCKAHAQSEIEKESQKLPGLLLPVPLMPLGFWEPHIDKLSLLTAVVVDHLYGNVKCHLIGQLKLDFTMTFGFAKLLHGEMQESVPHA